MKNIITRSLAPVLLLVIPLVTTLLGSADWGLLDFVVMGVLLFLVGLAYNGIIRKMKGRHRRLLYTVILVLLFLLAWAELGVGIFGTPFAGS